MNNKQVILKIKNVLEDVRIFLQNDGGDVTFVSYENNICTVKMLGACSSCPYVDTTFDEAIKKILMEEIQEIENVKFIV